MLEPGAAGLVDYQLPDGGSFAVPITGDCFSWAVPLTASEMQNLPRLSVNEPEFSSFTLADDVVTSMMNDLARDGPRQEVRLHRLHADLERVKARHHTFPCNCFTSYPNEDYSKIMPHLPVYIYYNPR